MSSKNRITEIIQKKDRKEYQFLFFTKSRFDHLAKLCEGIKMMDTELLKYFPVAIVAEMESFFRAGVATIIDKGEPFLTNLNNVQLSKKISFDFEIIKAFHGKKISIGEFVAHQLPFSSRDHILTMGDILGIKFLDEVKIVHDRWNNEVCNLPKEPIIKNFGKTFDDIQKVFELRHIICHESGQGIIVEQGDVQNYIESTVCFIEASNQLIMNYLYPNSPLTQADMNIVAGNDLSNSLEKLEEIKQKIFERLPLNRKETFIKADDLWETYYKGWAKFTADEYEGGTIWPTIYASEANTLVSSRIDELEIFLNSIDSE